jgi:voltage-gated potassium channel
MPIPKLFGMFPRNIQVALIVLISIIIIGTIGFYLLEDVDLFTAFYWTITTITTLGYGDIVPQSTNSKIFSVIIIIAGVATALYTFTAGMSFYFEGTLRKIVGARRMQERINQLKGHTIICGYGIVGSHIVKHFIEDKIPYVVIEKSNELSEQMFEDKILHIHGDATHVDVLEKAGIKRAKVIISCLTEDAESFYVLMEAKELNKNIKVIARASRSDSIKRFKKFGAERVIVPEEAGANQMVDFTKKYFKGGK